MAKRQSRKRWRWRDPATVIASKLPLEIDSAIRSMGSQERLQARWQVIEDAISFGRRALHVALEEAISYEKHRAAEQFEYFERTSALAECANKALGNLLTYIGPSGLDTSVDFPVVHVPRNWAKSGKIRSRVWVGKAGPDISKEQVRVLANAQSVLDGMRNYAAQRKEQLKHTRINDPDYGKRAFVYRLAEGWVFLTGKKPGKGRYPHGNPFLRFVDAAANDAGGFEDVEDFYSALKWTLDTLNRHERFETTTQQKTQKGISAIAARGPEWA